MLMSAQTLALLSQFCIILQLRTTGNRPPDYILKLPFCFLAPSNTAGLPCAFKMAYCITKHPQKV